MIEGTSLLMLCAYYSLWFFATRTFAFFILGVFTSEEEEWRIQFDSGSAILSLPIIGEGIIVLSLMVVILAFIVSGFSHLVIAMPFKLGAEIRREVLKRLPNSGG